jgi:hypothetical protein
VADINLIGHFEKLRGLLEEESRRELWGSLNCLIPTFDELGLAPNTPDLVVWQKCQQEQLVLITANRNKRGPNSLEAAIQALNTLESLPVITLGNADRFLVDSFYAARVADRVLEYLFEIDHHRGAGRLYVP